MLTIQGILSVAQKSNSNANEKSGILECPLSLFNVKYTQLNLLKVGKHQGFFVITQLKPHLSQQISYQ